MNIIYLHQYFSTPSMSSGTRSFEMARRLVKNGHKVYMLSSTHARSYKERKFFSNENGIFVWWLPVKYSNNMSYIMRLFSFIRYCYLAIIQARKIEYDIVFATSTPLTIAIPGIFLSKLKKTPFILEIRDLWPELPIAIGALQSSFSIYLAKLLEKWSYNNADHIIGLSEGMCKSIEINGQSRNKISNIPNGCDIDLFNVEYKKGDEFRSKYSWLGSNPLVIYTGALGKMNNVIFLVEIANHMKELNSNIRFLIIGKGKEENTILEYANKFGVLNKNLFFIRELPKNYLVNIYSAASVCTSLFLPLKEMEANSANKFFDALAAGKPIMINYRGWQAKLIKEYNAGIVVPSNNVSLAAKELETLISDKKRLLSTGKSARELGIKLFDRNKLYKSFESIFLSVSN